MALQISVHVQPAADTLNSLLQDGAAGSYDLAFIGASLFDHIPACCPTMATLELDLYGRDTRRC